MEARSLTALNTLAGNPPQYPINPAQEKQDPLTLYISRVPGTRGKTTPLSTPTGSDTNTASEHRCHSITFQTTTKKRYRRGCRQLSLLRPF